MPRPPKKSRAPKRRQARRRPRANPRNVPEWASLSVAQTITAPGVDFSCNAMYNLRGVLKLAGFTRAEEVAKAYQFYRVKSAKITFKFPFDTFLNTGSVARPNLYHMIDKAESISTLATLESLKNMGAKPRACDEKPISIMWKPSVLNVSEAVGGSQPAQYNLSPWLSTAHIDVQHQGLFFYAEQVLFGGTAQIYHAEIELQFEFKKPLLYATSSNTPSVSAVSATKDNSSNGIVDSIA